MTRVGMRKTSLEKQRSACARFAMRYALCDGGGRIASASCRSRYAMIWSKSMKRVLLIVNFKFLPHQLSTALSAVAIF